MFLYTQIASLSILLSIGVENVKNLTYNLGMNQTQLKIVELASKRDIWSMSLREIGKEIGVKNAGTVKYHLEKLIKARVLIKPKRSNALKKFKEILEKSQDALIDIPILGAANCGIATLVADEMFEGYLKVAPGLLPTKNFSNLFAIKAEGESLNKANIDGKSVESGDYLIVDTNLNPQDGKYVLSVIEGCANVKKFRSETDRIILESESTEDIPPIFIDKDSDYLINGVVIKVIKAPKGGEKDVK